MFLVLGGAAEGDADAHRWIEMFHIASAFPVAPVHGKAHGLRGGEERTAVDRKMRSARELNLIPLNHRDRGVRADLGIRVGAPKDADRRG